MLHCRLQQQNCFNNDSDSSTVSGICGPSINSTVYVKQDNFLGWNGGSSNSLESLPRALHMDAQQMWYVKISILWYNTTRESEVIWKVSVRAP